MEYIEQVACMAAVAPSRSVADRFAAVCACLEDELGVAADVIERDPDAAAIVLDGWLRRLVCAWYEAHSFWPPVAGNLLMDLERRAPELAWRVRLALRASDASARIAHARQLVFACAQEILARPRAGEAFSAADRSGWRLAPGERPGA